MRRRLIGTGWLAAFLGFVIILGAAGRQPASEPNTSPLVELQVTAPGLIAIEEERNVIRLRMEDPSKLAEAEALLRQAKGEDWVRGRRFELVDYDRDQLEAWRARLRQTPGAWNGVSFEMYNARINRIEFGMLTMESKLRLEETLDRLEIPRDAVLINLPDGALSEQNPLDGCQLGSRPPEPEQAGAFRLEVSQNQVRPGQTITLTAIGGDVSLIRGGAAYLQCWDGAQWSSRYTMFSGRTVLYSSNMVLTSEGYDARRPFSVLIPEDLSPGWYRMKLGVIPASIEIPLYQIIQVVP